LESSRTESAAEPVQPRRREERGRGAVATREHERQLASRPVERRARDHVDAWFDTNPSTSGDTVLHVSAASAGSPYVLERQELVLTQRDGRQPPIELCQLAFSQSRCRR